MIAAIGNFSPVSRQHAIYARFMAAKFRPAPLPQIPELSEAARERMRLAALANSSLLRVQGEIIRSNTAQSLVTADA